MGLASAKGRCPECGHGKWNGQNAHGFANWRVCRKCGVERTHSEWKQSYQRELEFNIENGFYEPKKKYSFMFEFKMKDCKTIFKEGWDAGVLVKQEVIYKLTKEQRKSNRFAFALHEDYNEFIKSNLVDFSIKEM